MILYTLPHSSYATKVAIVIAIKGIEGEFEMRKPPGRGSSRGSTISI